MPEKRNLNCINVSWSGARFDPSVAKAFDLGLGTVWKVFHNQPLAEYQILRSRQEAVPTNTDVLHLLKQLPVIGI